MINVFIYINLYWLILIDYINKSIYYKMSGESDKVESNEYIEPMQSEEEEN